KSASRQFESSPRMHHHFPNRLFARNLFDRLDCHGHRKHFAHFRFANMQGHFFAAFFAGPTLASPRFVPLPSSSFTRRTTVWTNRYTRSSFFTPICLNRNSGSPFGPLPNRTGNCPPNSFSMTAVSYRA